MQRCSSVATIIDIQIGESDRIERLEQFFAHFLARCAESSTLIADVRGHADWNAFPLSIVEHPLERRRQIIGELPIASIRSLRLNWFDAHYALFCVGGSISTAYAYAEKARRRYHAISHNANERFYDMSKLTRGRAVLARPLFCVSVYAFRLWSRAPCTFKEICPSP